MKWRWLLVALGGVAAATVIVFLVLLVDVASVGPWTTAFNRRLEAKAVAARLIGRPAGDVEAVLGRADDVTVSPTSQTFNYWPLLGVPVSKFQVHCRDGVVSGLELFDD